MESEKDNGTPSTFRVRESLPVAAFFSCFQTPFMFPAPLCLVVMRVWLGGG